MFESAEIGHRVGKAVYRKAVTVLRESLLQAQANCMKGKTFRWWCSSAARTARVPFSTDAGSASHAKHATSACTPAKREPVVLLHGTPHWRRYELLGLEKEHGTANTLFTHFKRASVRLGVSAKGGGCAVANAGKSRRARYPTHPEPSRRPAESLPAARCGC